MRILRQILGTILLVVGGLVIAVAVTISGFDFSIETAVQHVFMLMIVSYLGVGAGLTALAAWLLPGYRLGAVGITLALSAVFGTLPLFMLLVMAGSPEFQDLVAAQGSGDVTIDRDSINMTLALSLGGTLMLLSAACFFLQYRGSNRPIREPGQRPLALNVVMGFLLVTSVFGIISTIWDPYGGYAALAPLYEAQGLSISWLKGLALVSFLLSIGLAIWILRGSHLARWLMLGFQVVSLLLNAMHGLVYGDAIFGGGASLAILSLGGLLTLLLYGWVLFLHAPTRAWFEELRASEAQLEA